MTTTTGRVSFWYDATGLPAQRPPLSGDIDADVCIVGAGYTGLWTAYYLKKAAPLLRVVIVEERFAGYGASGRNGGWLTNSVTGGREQYVKSHGRAAAVAMQQAMNDTVDEVIRVADVEGIDADIVKGGELTVANNAAQLNRMQSFAASERSWRDAVDFEVLSAQEMAARVNVDGALGGVFQPQCARIQPAKLARGLAEAVEKLGVTIYEGTRVSEISAQRAVTARGTVSARFIVRATEGFTAGLAGLHRKWLPMNSSLIVTEPLDAATWQSIGWEGRETLGDFAHVYMYAQRTADDRIAFGGRGVPYRFGSGVDADGATPDSTVTSLRALLGRFFPATAGAAIDHAWSGVLGVPRDWAATVGLDPTSGLAWAGGYVGTGVTATNLAGRTLADLLLGADTALTRLPWVNHQVRNWEIEPLRWVAVKGLYAAYHAADRAEDRGRTSTSPIASMANVVAGRH
ncbi:NAD(P)/FAD-dependent oxidoreductase [Leifsonia sp. YAF41]|uniref:NAD(P)/FAD-dependent oxidoreductase n=1 Tax=Leifsonia sp. YAF41 TaxID=3233086 RepID=UPI003F994DE7